MQHVGGHHAPAVCRQWVVARPLADSTVRTDAFEFMELPLPDLEEGQALVRTRLINLHSRTRLKLPTMERPDGSGIIKPGQTDLANYGCAEIVASRDPALRVGDTVHWQLGWQDYQIISRDEGPIGYAPPTSAVRVLNGTDAPMNYVFRPEIAREFPADTLMHVFGTSGVTAWFGLRECGPVTAQDQILVAAANGSVGSLAAQIAKARGARVVGLAGGKDRCEWAVETLGIDACTDYRPPDLADRLRSAFPDGIDLFCDGVGGPLTEMVVPLMNRSGRLFAYGSSSNYYADKPEPAAVRGLRAAFGITPVIEEQARRKDLSIACWIVFDLYHERIAAEDALAAMLRSGELKAVTDVASGIENLPRAIIDMYSRPHAGKAQVAFEETGVGR